MKILFVMKHRGNAGNTHAVANYMRVAPKYGHSVAIYGTPIWYVPELQFSKDITSFDRVVYVYEFELYRIDRMHEAVILAKFPRQHRLVLDTDGMYNPVVVIDGYDFNHRNEAERTQWLEHLDALSDRVMQTTVARPINPRAGALTFYGYNKALQVDRAAAPQKQYDILHVGHNWWRWRQVSGELLPALQADSRPGRRDRVHRAVVGRAASRGAGGGTRAGFRIRPRGAAAVAHPDAEGRHVP